jgi:hypothetical protein
MFGNDPPLLYTRTLLLEHEGFVIESVDSSIQVASRLSEYPELYDLVILCHTVKLDEVRAIVPAAVKAKVWNYVLTEPITPRDFIEHVHRLFPSEESRAAEKTAPGRQTEEGRLRPN